MLEEQMQELKEGRAPVGRVESQILQLREEMHDGFSTVRDELRTEMYGTRDELRTEMHGIRDELRTEMHGIRDELRTEIHGIRDELREDIRIGVEESQNLARLLHQEAMHAVTEQVSGVRREIVVRLDDLRTDVREGDAETRRFIQDLFERRG